MAFLPDSDASYNVDANAPTRHFEYIDSLRGLAVLGVILVHTSQRFPGLHPRLTQFSAEGARGVQLFFVVSALTLMLSWHQRQDGALPFYIRRFFRIAPMFWLAILFFLLLDGFAPRYWAPGGIAWWQVALTSLFLHGLHPESINSVVPGGWSIAIEMTFYALFPLLTLICRSTYKSVLGLIVSLFLAKAVGAFLHHALHPAPPNDPQYLIDWFIFFQFFNQLPVFLTGVVVFFAINNPASRIGGKLATVLVHIALVCIIILPFEVGRIPLAAAHVVFAIFFGFLAYCMACGARTFAVNDLFGFFGKVSFSAYLWHFAVIDILDEKLATFGLNPFGLHDPSRGLPAFMLFLAVTAAVTFALSYATYRAIETPMIKFGSRFARRMKDTALAKP